MKYLMKLRQSGFSLIEVMMAVAITGGLALTLAKLQENTTKVTVTAETNNEVIQAMNQIQTILYDQSSCIATFTSAFGTNFNVPATQVLSGSVAYVDFANIGERGIRRVKQGSAVNTATIPWSFTAADVLMTAYKTRASTVPPHHIIPNRLSIESIGYAVVSRGADEFAQLRVTFNRESSVAMGQRVVRFVPLQITYDATRRFITCYSNISNAIDTAVANACRGNGAFLRADPVTGENHCFHETNIPTCPAGQMLVSDAAHAPGAGASLTAATESEMAVLNNRGTELRCVNAALNCACGAGMIPYVKNSAGDGTKNIVPQCGCVPACNAPDVLATNGTDYICQDRSCGAGQVGYYTNNTFTCAPACAGTELRIWTAAGPVCKALTCNNTATSAQQYLVGVTPAGDPICRTLLKQNPACSKGSYLGIAATGGLEMLCCSDCTAAEKANTCIGTNFTGGSDGCAMCEGTKSLTDGCAAQAATKCATDATFVSTCGVPCPGGLPFNEGVRSAPSAWVACTEVWQANESRTYTCFGGTCGGNCNGQEMIEYRPCRLYGGVREFSDCSSIGGSVHKVSSTGHIICMLPRSFGGGRTATGDGCTSNGYIGWYSPTCNAGWTRYSSGANYVATTANVGCCARNSSGGACGSTTMAQASNSGSAWRSLMSGPTYSNSGHDSRRSGWPGCDTNLQTFSCIATTTEVGCY